MEQQYIQNILTRYAINKNFKVETIAVGLINKVFKIIPADDNKAYILRNINQRVFKSPLDIINNMKHIHTHLKNKNSKILFTNLILTKEQEYYVSYENECFILMPFIGNTKTHTIPHNASLVEEAALQLGEFTKEVADMDITLLKFPIPDFHNLTLRYEQFLTALKHGNKERIANCKNEIDFLLSLESLCSQYNAILKNKNFKQRPTHHDTKISNVLFDDNDKGVCMIDWDTLMPGYFISDIGDMCRTYCCSVTEEEKELSKVFFKEDFFEKILSGYLKDMKAVLSKEEKEHFVYAGKFMIYMQALRFLSDYFNDDVYYTIKYPENNLVRTLNQMQLLKDFIKKENILLAMQEKFIA